MALLKVVPLVAAVGLLGSTHVDAGGKITLSGHTREVNTAAFSPDGKIIATGGNDATIRLWDAATGSMLATLKSENNIWSVAFHPAGRFLASGEFFSKVDGPGNLKIWDVASRRAVSDYAHHTEMFRSVAFSPDGKLVAVGGGGNALPPVTVILDPANLRGKVIELNGLTKQVNTLAFSPDGKTLATGTEGRDVRLWDVATGALKATREAHTSHVNCVAFSPDGKRLASSSMDKTVKFYDPATLEPRGGFTPHDRSVTSVAFSPDGKLIATASEDESVKIWDAATLTLKTTYDDHGDFVNCVTFSPDGKSIVTTSDDKTARIWPVNP